MSSCGETKKILASALSENYNLTMKKIMFVCLGNICRSPAAEGVYKNYLNKQNISDVAVESSGTSAYHNGEKADTRMRKAARTRGIELTTISKNISFDKISEYDLILAMDRSNQKELLKNCSERDKNKIKLFSDFKSNKEYIDVPDPYYGGEIGFNNVLDIIEDALDNITEYINGI